MNIKKYHTNKCLNRNLFAVKLLCTYLLIAFHSSAAIASPNEDLLHAIKMQNMAEVKRSIDRGADVNFKPSNNDLTLLMIAVQNNNLKIVNYLIAKGADVNARNTLGETVLMFAYDTKILKLLIQHGGDVNAKTSNDRTVLMLANSIEAMKILLESGAQISTNGFQGTALIHECRNYSPSVDVVKFLLEHGANVNATLIAPGWTTDGMTPLLATIRSIHQYDGNKNYSQVEVVRLLIQRGADVNYRNKTDDEPLLIRAVIGGHPEIVRILLQAGADTKARNNRGQTALSIAQYFKKEKIVEILRSAGTEE